MSMINLCLSSDGEYGDNSDEGYCRLDFTRERHNSTTLDEQVEYLEEQLSVMESQGKRRERGKEGGGSIELKVDIFIYLFFRYSS